MLFQYLELAKIYENLIKELLQRIEKLEKEGK